MKWHHSLYWRIAIGFVACLALLLVVQAVLFVWVVARTGRSIPNQPPDRLAQTIAVDIAQELQRSPDADVEAYVRAEHGDAQPFFVLLRGGRMIEINGPFDAPAINDARRRFEILLERGPGDGRGFPPPGRGFGGRSGPPRDGPPGQRPPPMPRGGPPDFRPFRPAAIIVDGVIAGMVVVPPGPPFTFLLRRYAPTLALVAVITLLVGAALAAFLIVAPVRRRLSAVELTARQLGAGDWQARAPESGDDEIAAVGLAFNAMAGELAARAQALSESDRARRQLLADVSHELTTPVTAISGYLETLRMPELGVDEATRTRYLGIIEDETARLERIIGDLLDLARLEGGGGALGEDDVRVGQLFARVRERHERALAEAGVTLTERIDPGAEQVRGDRDRLEQALQNLVANALRFAPSGSVIELAARSAAARTATSSGTGPNAITISVTDHGSGIGADHLAHVFDRFYKAETSRAVRQRAGGSGLGLSIVKAIVERHGGTITVESRPGLTTFEMTLPIRSAQGDFVSA